MVTHLRLQLGRDGLLMMWWLEALQLLAAMVACHLCYMLGRDNQLASLYRWILEEDDHE